MNRLVFIKNIKLKQLKHLLQGNIYTETKNSYHFYLLFQLVNKQLEQAQQELSSASSEEDKAKATIAVECAEALLKALH